MKSASSSRLLAGLIAIAIIALVGFGLLFALTSGPPRHRYVEGAPLLQQAEALFNDTQIGLQFAPPKEWAMQVRSTESPGNHLPERTVVKYKRLIPNVAVAWLKVVIKDIPEEQKPIELLRGRKPPEKDWKVSKDVEDDLKIGNHAAARITFGGPFDPDGRGQRDFTCEIVVVRRGGQIFEFSGTFPTADVEARKQIRAAIDSAAFGK